MRPKHVAALFIVLTAFLLPGVAHAEACWYLNYAPNDVPAVVRAGPRSVILA
jgi:hypothetical protein